MSVSTLLGQWSPAPGSELAFEPEALLALASQTRSTLHVVRESVSGRVGLARGGVVAAGAASVAPSQPWLATLPAMYPEWLGDRSFGEAHGVRFPYAAGEMANGIATTDMVVAMAEAGMLGFFGAAGLPLARVGAEIETLIHRLGPDKPWGVNIIHSPNEPAAEEALADLLIRAGVPCVSASAFMSITPAIVRCAAAGLTRDSEGQPVRARALFAKVSRPEIAERFMSPPPAAILQALVTRGLITPDEAGIAADLPLCEDITIEADSGGHTDNRPLTVLLPAMLSLRDQISLRYASYPRIRIGAAGGLGTPAAVAAAFALGADYVMTGSVNQAAVESGLCEAGKALLCLADVADVAMAPSADMFELGVKVQVLKRGTFFAQRANRLYEAYTQHESLEALPPAVRARLESEIFKRPLEAAWQDTRAFWATRDPEEVARAEREPKHLMALTFRGYLGMSSRWAITGEDGRKPDFQIWCGPAMGAFNRWAAGTFLADPTQRSVVQIARNLLEGACVLTRAQQLRLHGVALSAASSQFTPRPLA